MHNFNNKLSFTALLLLLLLLVVVVVVVVVLTQYRAGDKIEKNEMGWACGAYG
jgi:cell division protein FtsL